MSAVDTQERISNATKAYLAELIESTITAHFEHVKGSHEKPIRSILARDGDVFELVKVARDMLNSPVGGIMAINLEAFLSLMCDAYMRHTNPIEFAACIAKAYPYIVDIQRYG